MNPGAMESAVRVLLGADIARAMAGVARFHKEGAACTVSVPTWVMVLLGEKLAEVLEENKTQAGIIARLEAALIKGETP